MTPQEAMRRRVRNGTLRAAGFTIDMIAGLSGAGAFMFALAAGFLLSRESWVPGVAAVLFTLVLVFSFRACRHAYARIEATRRMLNNPNYENLDEIIRRISVCGDARDVIRVVGEMEKEGILK